MVATIRASNTTATMIAIIRLVSPDKEPAGGTVIVADSVMLFVVSMVVISDVSSVTASVVVSNPVVTGGIVEEEGHSSGAPRN